MEKSFDISNFEESLKQHADDFTMIPSRRIWKGIYNDLHPGSRWPSITMGLFVFMAFLGIGFWNISPRQENTSPRSKKSVQFNPLSKKTENQNYSSEKLLSKAKPGTGILVYGDFDASASVRSPNNENQNSPGILLSFQADGMPHSMIEFPEWHFNKSTVEALLNIDAPHTVTKSKAAEVLRQEEKVTAKLNAANQLIAQTPHTVIPPLQNSANGGVTTNSTSQNKKIQKKEQRKVSWLFYLTPSVSSVYLHGKPVEYHEPTSGISPVLFSPNGSKSMVASSTLNLAAGAQVKIPVSGRIKLLAGAEVATGGYRILANKVHPTFAYLVLEGHDGVYRPKKYITFYGNGNGNDEIMLHNKQVRVSMPVGAEVYVLQSRNMDISVAATLAPSLLLENQAYILSADGRNFVSDDDLLRNTNLYGELGTFVTFESQNLKWQVGPTIRYQGMSSFRQSYPVKEHLIDYGIKVGISK